MSSSSSSCSRCRPEKRGSHSHRSRGSTRAWHSGREVPRDRTRCSRSQQPRQALQGATRHCRFRRVPNRLFTRAIRGVAAEIGIPIGPIPRWGWHPRARTQGSSGGALVVSRLGPSIAHAPSTKSPVGAHPPPWLRRSCNCCGPLAPRPEFLERAAPAARSQEGARSMPSAGPPRASHPRGLGVGFGHFSG